MEQKNQSRPICRVSAEIGGRSLVLETGNLANQANGSVLVTYGESVILATATMNSKPMESVDFFPLTVDFEENYYAAGKIRGSRFMKRKGKPSDKAILTGRVIDRGIRPFFPEGMRNEVQIILTALSFDRENDSEFLAMVGAYASLAISDIPFDTVLGGIKIGLIEDKLIINPKTSDDEKNRMTLTVTTTEEGKIAMVEAGSLEVSEEKVKEALRLSLTESQKVIDLIKELQTKAGKEKKIVPLFEIPSEIADFVKKETGDQLAEIVANYQDKPTFDSTVRAYKETSLPALIEKYQTKNENSEIKNIEKIILEGIEKTIKVKIRALFLEKGQRIDRRGIEEIRPLQIEAGVLPRTHGSAIFARGWTQGLTTTTLGSPGSALTLEGMEEELESKQHYMHFYSFPPFSVGECRPMRGPGRREIGHGALGEKALEPVIPPRDQFPYTIVMHTEIMSSDGSTSMASVCGSTLALMDSGVPITKPVAGIAMGLMYNPENEKYTVLTDLCALEDYSGFMDFKVAGTNDGITAIQMDIKLKGLPLTVLEQALDQAKKARLEIIEAMVKVLPKPRKKMSPYAPRIETVVIPVDKIRDVIGAGGKTINGIIEKTGVMIDIEQDGTVCITSENEASLEEAKKIIISITKEVEVDEVYVGEVVKIMDFGAFVSLTPNQDGLVHISQISEKRVENIRDHLKEGDEIKVKVKSVDNQGRVNLTMLF